MRKAIGHVLSVAAFLALAAPSGAKAATPAADPAMVSHTPMGDMLTDGKGMTLYTFDKDPDGKSVCNGPCADKWPPLKADAGMTAPAGYSIVTRDDGSKQWAYKGKPLYTWTNDKKPGDMTGDGFLNGAWHAAKP